MKRTVFLALAVTLLLSVAALAVQASPPGQPFTGVWKSIDSWDGSRQHLTITPVRHASEGYHIVIFDHGATACGLDSQGQPMYAGIGTGSGWLSEDVLQMQFAFWCLGHPRWFFADLTPTFTYEDDTDTLFDSWGTRWYRQAGK